MHSVGSAMQERLRVNRSKISNTMQTHCVEWRERSVMIRVGSLNGESLLRSYVHCPRIVKSFLGLGCICMWCVLGFAVFKNSQVEKGFEKDFQVVW